MATNQFLMLEEISMDYHAFRKDQVLTEKQLNDLINFFEDQDRMTRTYLIGVGLVCGLVIDFNAAAPSITVGKGCGVTTDGDLLWMQPTTFNHYQNYSNREKGTNDPIYDPFWPGGTQMDLWELVIPDKNGELPLNAKPLTAFKAGTGEALEDLVALLYLEYYLQEPDKCTAIDCDNQGPHQIANIKVLLLRKTDMQKIIDRNPNSEVIADSIYKKYNQANTAYPNLPALKARRVILNAVNTASISVLAKQYINIVQDGGLQLVNAVGSLYTAYQFLVDPATQTNINSLKAILTTALSVHPKIYHAQYVYDFYKDVLAAYNELREALYRCASECCPDKYAFPKHIMLGEVKSSGASPAVYRHDFYPSPALSAYRDQIARCKSMWARLQQIVQSFNLQDQPTDVRITPSADYDRLLEHRAIPFYYKNVKNMIGNWNYGMGVRGAEKHNLSYHAGQYASGIDSSLHPLDFNIDGNNFFRIEGHLGKSLSQAFIDIDRIRQEKSVPFDLVAVRINKAGNLRDIKLSDFECQFEDLMAVLKAWLVEQNCLYSNVSRFFSGFNTNRREGFHARISDYKDDSGVLQGGASPVLTLLRDDDGKSAANLRINRNASREAKEESSSARLLTDAPQSSGIKLNTNITGYDSEQPFCRTVYIVDNVVFDNLERENNALGNYFAATPFLGSMTAEDYIMQVKEKSANDPQLKLLSEDERMLVYEAPIYIVASIADASKRRPFDLNDISLELIERYVERMERLCTYVKRLRSRLESILARGEYNRNGFETYYIFMLQQLIANCCAAEKIEALLEEIDRRKKKILASLLFANYAKNHPGLEHKAGVHRGGTFVLLYAQDEDTKAIRALHGNNDTLELSHQRLLQQSNKAASRDVYENIDAFAYYLVVNQGKVDFDKEVAYSKRINQIREGSLESQQFDRMLLAKIREVCAALNREEEASLASRVVVADFTLPYLCCSDCPPISFIIPKEKYSLSLPKATACSDEQPLLFKKEPANGTVKAAAGFQNTVVDLDSGTYFDPSKVLPGDYGKEITFTINDQETNCRITVVKHPVAKFGWKLESENDDVINIIFTNDSDDTTGTTYVYDWDFNNQSPVVRVTNKNAIVIPYSKDVLLKYQYKGKIPVKLTAINGGCTDTYTEDVTYQEEVPVSLKLPADMVCSNNPVMNFTITPANGVVASATEPGAVIKTAGGYDFDPSKVKDFAKPITFTVNGKPTTCVITVYRTPTAGFGVSNVKAIAGTPYMEATFTNQSNPTNEPNMQYNWSFNDGQTKSMTSEMPFSMTFNMQTMKAAGLKNLVVKLEAVNPACGDSKTGTIPFPTVQEQPQSCPDIVKQFTSNDNGYYTSAAVLAFINSQKATPDYAAIKSQVMETQSILDFVVAPTSSFDNATNQLRILQRIRTQLDAILASKFSKAVNERLVVPQIRSMMMLAVNLVRCYNKELDGQVREVLHGILYLFEDQLPEIFKNMPTIDDMDVLEHFFEEYLKTMFLKDPFIIDQIEKVYIALKTV